MIAAEGVTYRDKNVQRYGTACCTGLHAKEKNRHFTRKKFVYPYVGVEALTISR